MKHLKLFNDTVSYETWKNSEGFVLPNVSYIEETKGIWYEPSITIEMPSIGASIYCTDGKFYSHDSWISANKNNSDAIGVAVYNGSHAFVIHPTSQASELAYANTKTNFNYVFSTDDSEVSKTDFSGELNTQVLINNFVNKNICSTPAAEYCMNTIFAHGKHGYLPSVGEMYMIYQYRNEVNLCLTAINGEIMLFDEDNNDTPVYWTSTRTNDKYYAWTWMYNSPSKKTVSDNPWFCAVRPIATLDQIIIDELEKPTISTPSAGVYIYTMDKNFYTEEEYLNALSSNSLQDHNIIGIIVSNGKHSFVMHSDGLGTDVWGYYNNNSYNIPEITFKQTDDAKNNYTGLSNTSILLNAWNNDIIECPFAALECRKVVFPHGKKGYLPSAGELNMIMENRDSILSCINTIQGSSDINSWSSTLYSDLNVWCIKNDFTTRLINQSTNLRPVSVL